jgi:heliorhodopsin
VNAAIERLAIGADPGAWAQAGFTVVENRAIAGSVRLEFGEGDGILGWRLAGIEETEIDGLPLSPAWPWLQYRRVGPWRDYLYGERGYIVLSLTAKSALAWQVFGGTLAGGGG